MQNALTIDVEDYYSILARDRLGFETPPTDAVVRCTEQILELLGRHGVTATFFVLGEVAEVFPQLVRRIAAAGHEIGVHGGKHCQLFKLSPEDFRREVGRARELLADTVGQPVHGHRAPAFSIRPDTRWGLQVLAELGFRYDSSVFPIAGKRYGWPGFREDIHEMNLPSGATIIEAPLSVVRLLGKRLPACGGGYLRHLPYAYTRWAVRRIQRVRPAIVYMHPYDIDVQPVPEPYRSGLEQADTTLKRHHARQLRNRHTVEGKLTRLLQGFAFAPLGEVITSALASRSE